MNTPVERYESSVVPVNRPVDRVRWASIFAGIFAALSSLIVLSVLGLAIGLSSYNAGEPASAFGIGAGIWGAVSALIAFLIGGWLAARTSALAGRGNGVLNGAMVWVVAVPLMLFLLGSGVGMLLNTASNVANAGANAANVAGLGNGANNNGANNKAAGNNGANANGANTNNGSANGANGAANGAGANVTPQGVENATRTASGPVWGTLLWIVLGFLASSLGGMLGARRDALEMANTQRTSVRSGAGHD